MANIQLKNTVSLRKLQEWFGENFANLKIEFYEHKHSAGQGNEKTDMLKDLEQSIDIPNEEIELTIFDDYSTNLVEHIFKTKLNLNVQVFRKNGSNWIQTITTDNWTLKEQMERALFHQA